MDNKKILLIDDDVTFSRILTDALEAHGGYEVVVAESGEEGLVLFKSENPDLVVLDMLMPKMNGLGFLKELHARDGEIQRPVIISSNIDSMEEISSALALGVQGYLVKADHDLESIVETIGRTISNQQQTTNN